LHFGGGVQLDPALAHEPVVLKATGDGVQAGRVLETELLSRWASVIPG
jgi:hypothetical protein